MTMTQHDPYPKNGTGNISTSDLEEGLRQLKVFEGMSKEQASLATRRFDQNGDGTVSLRDFLAFAGRPYAANDRPLEAKLRRVLLKAEAVSDGCSSIRWLKKGPRLVCTTAQSSLDFSLFLRALFTYFPLGISSHQSPVSTSSRFTTSDGQNAFIRWIRCIVRTLRRRL